MPHVHIISLMLAAQVVTSTPTETPIPELVPIGEPPAPEAVAEPPAIEEPAPVEAVDTPATRPAMEPATEPAGTPTEPKKASVDSDEKTDKDIAVGEDDFFQFSDFVNTVVTFAISNINVFAGPGERTSQTSGYRIGNDDNFPLFLSNVDTRYSGYESLSRLVIYKKLPAFWERWETEAALAALVLADTESGRFNFFDSGTYLRVIRKLGDGAEHEVGSFDLTAWPVSADRFRLGYTYILSWGGTAIFPGKLQSSSITEGAVPGVRLRWRAPHGSAYGFLGFKSALLLSREPGVMAGEQVPNYGILGGGGYDIAETLFVEGNAGFFQKGTQERPGLEGRRISAYGASLRATFYTGDRPKASGDFRLYRNDPASPANFNLFKGFKSSTGFSVSAEGTLLAQNLEDPDEFGSELIVPAFNAGLRAVGQLGYMHLGLDAFYQSANFILFNVPGFVPFQATPAAASTTPEFFAAASIAYEMDDLKLRPKFSVGLKVPATYQGAVPTEQGTMVGGARPGDLRTQLIVDETTRVVLPPGEGATPIVAALIQVPWYLSNHMAISGEIQIEFNDNQPRIAQDNERGEVTYIFDDPIRLGFALVAQARW